MRTYAITKNDTTLMTSAHDENTKDEVIAKYNQWLDHNKSVGFLPKYGWENGEKVDLTTTVNGGTKILESFIVKSQAQVALDKYKSIIATVTRSAGAKATAEKDFAASVKKNGALYAVTYCGRELAICTGFSGVWERILDHSEITFFMGLSTEDQLPLAEEYLTALKKTLAHINEYFMSGILRSSSASSSNIISNVVDDAKRDGVLQALRELAFLL